MTAAKISEATDAIKLRVKHPVQSTPVLLLLKLERQNSSRTGRGPQLSSQFEGPRGGGGGGRGSELTMYFSGGCQVVNVNSKTCPSPSCKLQDLR